MAAPQPFSRAELADGPDPAERRVGYSGNCESLCPGPVSLSRARRRIGAAPLRRLFEILAGPVAHLGQAGSLPTGRQAPPRAAEGIGD